MADQELELDAALNKLRCAGHNVHIVGPFSNGSRLIEIDEVVRNHHEILALAEETHSTTGKTNREPPPTW
ncbi:MAG: hypothetical protein ACRYFU_08660 [Janthinobacterium lividum]